MRTKRATTRSTRSGVDTTPLPLYNTSNTSNTNDRALRLRFSTSKHVEKCIHEILFVCVPFDRLSS